MCCGAVSVYQMRGKIPFAPHIIIILYVIALHLINHTGVSGV